MKDLTPKLEKIIYDVIYNVRPVFIERWNRETYWAETVVNKSTVVVNPFFYAEVKGVLINGKQLYRLVDYLKLGRQTNELEKYLASKNDTGTIEKRYGGGEQ